MTPSFNMVERCSICIACTARYRLWTVINTFMLCAVMVVMICHQIAVVFMSSWRRAHSFSRYHHHCIAHCTWDFVLTNCRKWGTLICLILCTIYVGTSSLSATCVPQIVWVIREAEIVSSTSTVTPIASSSSSCIDELCSRSSWTCGPPPPSVHHPTNSGTRGTSRTSVSFLPSQTCWP